MPAQRQTLAQKVQGRQLLAGRLAAAEWLSMSEPEVAREVRDVESDPLYRELSGAAGGTPLIRRRRWPGARLHASFYELNEGVASETGSAAVEDLLEDKEELLGLIRRIGREAFEKSFLFAEVARPLPELCRELGISEGEGRRILDLVLEVGARSEFFRPAAAEAGKALRYHTLARIESDPRDRTALHFQFLAPHWVRGRYEVAHDRIEAWQVRRSAGPKERLALRRLLKRLDMLNMRQDTLYQILSRAVTAQSAFLASRQAWRRRPLSLRELARRIGVAPSTVSRAVARRSVELPWGEEVPLIRLLSGQREVVRSVLEHWKERGELGPGVSDARAAERLAGEAGIPVSRRTVNAVRRLLD